MTIFQRITGQIADDDSTSFPPDGFSFNANIRRRPTRQGNNPEGSQPV